MLVLEWCQSLLAEPGIGTSGNTLAGVFCALRIAAGITASALGIVGLGAPVRSAGSPWESYGHLVIGGSLKNKS